MDLDKYCQVFPTEQVADGIADCGNTLHAQLGGNVSGSITISWYRLCLYLLSSIQNAEYIISQTANFVSCFFLCITCVFPYEDVVSQLLFVCLINVINESWITNSAPHEVSATLFGVGPTFPLFIQTHVRFQMVKQHH